MRLLFVTHSLQRIGGVSRSAKRIIAGLRALGHEVQVLALDDGSPGQSPQSQPSVSGLEHTRKVESAIAFARPNLLVGFYGSQGGFSATVAARLTGLPVVTCLRGNDVNRDFYSPIYHHLAAFAIERANAVTVVSKEMAHRVKALFGVESTFIPNSVCREDFFFDPVGASQLREQWQLGNRPVVGLFGEFKPSKGLSYLSTLADSLAGAVTLLIGKVRTESRREVPAWVREVPYIEDLHTLRSAYSLCDLVLQPSIDDGMPNTLLEAMACERVVLASPVGGMPDLIRHGVNGWLADPADWPSLISSALASPSPQLGQAARNSLPSPHEEAMAFIDLFERVLREQK